MHSPPSACVFHTSTPTARRCLRLQLSFVFDNIPLVCAPLCCQYNNTSLFLLLRLLHFVFAFASTLTPLCNFIINASWHFRHECLAVLFLCSGFSTTLGGFRHSGKSVSRAASLSPTPQQNRKSMAGGGLAHTMSASVMAGRWGALAAVGGGVGGRMSLGSNATNNARSTSFSPSLRSTWGRQSHPYVQVRVGGGDRVFCSFCRGFCGE